MTVRLLVVLLLLVVSSCSRSGTSGERVFSLVPRSSPLRGTLTFDLLSDPKTFNPALAQETTSTQVLGYLFRGLTRISPYDGKIKPDLAARWRVDTSGRRVTFTLGKGLRWSDGVPLTAHDVVFTFTRVYYNPAVAAAVRDILMVDGKPFRVRALDDRTVEFETAKPFAPLLEELGVEILPEHLLAKAVDSGHFNTTWSVRTPPQEIVGTGPFRLEKYIPGQYIRFSRNPLYSPPPGPMQELLEEGKPQPILLLEGGDDTRGDLRIHGHLGQKVPRSKIHHHERQEDDTQKDQTHMGHPKNDRPHHRRTSRET